MIQKVYKNIYYKFYEHAWNHIVIRFLCAVFIWKTGESGDINVCQNKTLNCYPNYMNGLHSENNLSNTKPNKMLCRVPLYLTLKLLVVGVLD